MLAYHSVKLDLLANCNRFVVDSNTYFLSGKALYPLKILPCPKSELFCNTFVSVVCDWHHSSHKNFKNINKELTVIDYTRSESFEGIDQKKLFLTLILLLIGC